jgi:hypothetical protein
MRLVQGSSGKLDWFREVMENPNYDQWNPDSTMALSWLYRNNGVFSGLPQGNI